MPGTASNQTTKKSGRAARLSARVRAQSATATTPVLFRLPTIDLLSIAKEREAAERAEEVLERQQEELAAATAAMPAETMQSDPAAERVFTSTLLTNSRGEVAAKQRATESRAVPATDTSATPSPIRSWWEHWSSGIVLILLIIALVTASIIALNDSGSNQSELAKAQNNQQQDEIEIPDLADLNEEIVGATETIPAPSDANLVSAGPDTSNTDALQPNQPLNDESSLANVDDTLIPSALTLGNEENTADSSMDLIGAVNDVAAEPVGENDPANVGLLPPSSTTASLPAGTATDATNPAPNATLSGEITLPVNNASNNTVQLGQPVSSESGVTGTAGVNSALAFPEATQPTLSASKNNDPAAGASPSLYDGAANPTLNTNQPSIPALLTGSSTTLPPSGSASVGGSSVTNPSPTPAGSTTPIRQTATPDFDTDCVIKKYLEFSKLPANRYAPN